MRGKGVIMAKQVISARQRETEGRLLASYFAMAKDKDPSLTQESLAGEIGVSQGLVAQWLSGRTPIPDSRLLWLGVRLGFNPVEFRPALLQFSIDPSFSGNSKLIAVLRQIPKDQEDRIAGILDPIVKALIQNQR